MPLFAPVTAHPQDQARSSPTANSGITVDYLTKPVPVTLMCWTVGAEPDGTVFFKADPYDRDAAVLAALNSAPVFTPPAERGGSS